MGSAGSLLYEMFTTRMEELGTNEIWNLPKDERGKVEEELVTKSGAIITKIPWSDLDTVSEIVALLNKTATSGTTEVAIYNSDIAQGSEGRQVLSSDRLSDVLTVARNHGIEPFISGQNGSSMWILDEIGHTEEIYPVGIFDYFTFSRANTGGESVLACETLAAKAVHEGILDGEMRSYDARPAEGVSAHAINYATLADGSVIGVDLQQDIT